MYVSTSGYKFVDIAEPTAIKIFFKNLLSDLELLGTIYIASEGINIAIAGKPSQIVQFKEILSKDEKFNTIFFKDSYCDYIPFKKVVVKIKSEIITSGFPGLHAQNDIDSHLEPATLKAWLDQNKKVILIDTRNYYEYNLGTFDNAINPKIETFKAFPDFVDSLPEDYKDETVVVFCTGGVRCEKALPIMTEKGFKQVYQLNGGILNYFQQCGSAHWHGNCFVFDDRIAMDSCLKDNPATLCQHCHNALMTDEQMVPDYIAGKKCHYCTEAC